MYNRTHESNNTLASVSCPKIYVNTYMYAYVIALVNPVVSATQPDTYP